MRRARLLVVACVAAVHAGLGCSRDEVVHYRVPKEPSVASVVPVGGPRTGTSLEFPLRAGSGGISWTLPAGWRQEPGGSAMRYATLRAPVQGNLDVSVTVLPGDAGGELANVNRWRGQMGLTPFGKAEIETARTSIRSALGPVSVYDFASRDRDDRRLVAGLLFVDGSSWFLKMAGSAKAVERACPDFLRLLESLRRETDD